MGDSIRLLAKPASRCGKSYHCKQGGVGERRLYALNAVGCCISLFFDGSQPKCRDICFHTAVSCVCVASRITLFVYNSSQIPL